MALGRRHSIYYPQHSYGALICLSPKLPLCTYMLGLWRYTMYCLTCSVIIMYRKNYFSWKYWQRKRCHSSGMWWHIDYNSVIRTSYLRYNNLQKRKKFVVSINENTGMTVRHMEIKSLLNPASHESSEVTMYEHHVNWPTTTQWQQTNNWTIMWI